MSRRARTSAPASSRRRGHAPATPRTTRTLAPLWPILAIAAAALLAYWNALDTPFVFDDDGTIVENATIRHVWSSLAGGPVQSATAGRPLVNFTFALNYAAGGTRVFGYHAVNLLILVACGWLLYGCVRRVLTLPSIHSGFTSRAASIAAAVALLWVVHPINSETVNYVTQRSESLMALFYLGTIYAGVRGMTVPAGGRWYAVSVAACAAGMLCKESMVTAPVVVLLLDAALVARSFAGALRQRPAYYLALAATWSILALLIVEGPRWRSAGFASGVDPWTYLLNQPPLLLRYLRLMFVPTGLVLDYGLPQRLTLVQVWAPAAVVLALLLLSLALWRWSRVAGFAATAVFILLSPTSSILPIATEAGAERRMFLPSAALIAIVVCALFRLLQRVDLARARQRGAAALVVVAAAGLAASTMQRNAEFDDPVTIWRTTLDRWPTARAHYNLGIVLKAAGQRAEAIEEYRRALPDAAAAHYALAFELQADGRYAEAIDQYRMFIDSEPLDANVPRAYHQIGRAFLSLGRNEEATAAFRDTLARAPGNADARAGLADALMAMERWSDAVNAYQDYLRVNPGQPMALFNMGLALVRLDRDAEARDAFATVVRMQPDNVSAHVNLAFALANTGNYGDSVREFRRAAELEKDPAARADIEAAIGELLGAH